MQDKKIHIDKKTTDLAWQEMNKILDQEMPTEKNKRRPLLWWYTTGIGLAAGLAAIWLINLSPIENAKKTDLAFNENKKENNNTETNKSLITDINTTHPNFTKKENKATLNDNNNINKDIDNSLIADNTSSRIDIENKTTNKNNNRKEKNKKEVAQNGNNIEIVENINSEIKKLNVLDFPEKTIANTELKINIPAEKENLNTKKEITRISNISKLAFLPISEINSPPAKQPIVPISKSKFNNIDLFAYAAANLPAPKQDGSGFGTGILASIPLGESKFSLETGLGYSYISQPLSYISSIEESAAIFEPGTVEFSDYNEQLLDDLANATYDISNIAATPESVRPLGNLRLHYIQVPITLSYRLKRFRFFGGLQAGVLLKGKNRSFKGGILGNSELKTEDARVSNEGSFSSTPLSNYELAANVGFGYDFSKRFGINLAYSAGLTDVITSNTQKDYNRFYQFTIRYKIIGK